MALGRGIRIPIDVDSTGAVAGIKRVNNQLDRLDRNGSAAMGRLKTAGLAAGAAIGTGLAITFQTGVRELIEFEKVAARTANVIETTGGAAGVTAEHVANLSNELQKLTGTEDDVIQAGANVLLTFTNISAKGGVFDRTLALANDLSVALGTDMESAARRLGKVLQEPEKGMGGLARAVGGLTNKQQAHVDSLLKQNRLLDAQRFILGLLEKRYKGAASSEGEVTEATQRLNREFEDFSETTVGKIIPALRAFFAWGNRIEARLETMRQAVRSFVTDSVRAMSTWGRQIVGALQRVVSVIRGFSSAVFNAARSIGDSIVDGIVKGIQDAAGAIGQAIRNAIPNDITPGFDVPFLQSGGLVPGSRNQAVPIIAHSGEVVLNERQQREIGSQRIFEVLHRTGGIRAGRGAGFAKGGVLDNAIAFAKAQVGEPYLWGGGHAYGDFSAWDCSGFASNVAARIPGYTGGIGTTYTLEPKSSPAKGGEPVVFGFRPGHMGIRLNGTWYDAGSGGVEVGDARWSSTKVPPGLQYLAALDPSRTAAGDGPDPGPRLAPDRRTPIQKVADLIKASGAFGGAASKGLAKSIVGGVPDVSSGDLPSFTGGQERKIGAAGRAARHKARVAGKSPAQVTEAGEDAEREAERKILRRYRATAKKDIKMLSKRKAALLAAYQKLGRTKPKNAAGRAAKQKLMAQMRAKLADITEEINDVRAELAEINARLAELLEEEEAEAYEDAYDAAQGAAEGAVDTAPAVADTTPTGPTADQQAAIDQANERARVAARGQAISDSFLRTLFGSGSIDPASGSINVTFNTLHPGDPAIQGEIASWVVGALGGQGSVPRSAYSVGI